MRHGIVLLLLLGVSTLLSAQTVDNDGDGWTPAQGDCCDTTLTCPHPELVNPGAFEIPGNGIDDDCDGTIDNALPACDGGVASNTTNGFDFAKAIDLCQVTTLSPPIDQKRWGVISAQLLLADGTGTPSLNSHAVRSAFGSGNTPQSGGAFAILSTGSAAASGQTNPNFIAFEPGSNNGTTSAFPADWLAANGGVVPNAPGCPTPSGTQANDPVMLKLQIRVPTNMHSFSVSSRFFTSEFAEWVCSPYTDVSVVLLDSTYAGSPANPADKNIGAITVSGNRYLVSPNLARGTSYFTACINGQTGCSGSSPGSIATCSGTAALIGTGFDSATPGYCDSNSLLGGATSWLTTVGNVVPGEVITLRFVIWDTSDHSWDSLELLDNFQWWPDTLTPGTYITGAAPIPAPTGVVASASGTSVNVNWTAVGSASSYQVFRRAAGGSFTQVGTPSNPTFGETATADSAYLYRVRAVNSIGISPDSAADLTTTVAYTDNPLAAGTTFVKSTHLAELRTGVNAVRQLAGLTAFSFTDTPAADLPIKAVHVTELRSALDQALTALGFASGGYTDAVATDVPVKAVHFQELRDRMN